MSFYEILVFIHIFSAILGMGPGLVMTTVVTRSNPQNMTEVKHSFKVRNSLHIFTMVGGILLLVTGLLMGFLNTYLFSQVWYIVSLVLYLIALTMGPLVLSPISKPLKQSFNEIEGEEIPEHYHIESKKLFRYEHLINILFLTIITLMILKPF